MRKIIFSSTLSLLLALHLFAQRGEKITGIYKNKNDFTEDKLSYPVECNETKNSIRVNDLFNKPYVIVKYNGNTYAILKKTFYGYKNCKEERYVFYENKELLLLNRGEEIAIYKNENTRIREGARINVTNKYFMVEGENKIQKLTISNLKNAFPSNKKFQQLVDENFKYNTDLGAYDATNHIFKITYLLNESR